MILKLVCVLSMSLQAPEQDLQCSIRSLLTVVQLYNRKHSDPRKGPHQVLEIVLKSLLPSL